MNLRLRFFLLFLTLLGGLLLSLLRIHRLQTRHLAKIAQAETKERETLLRELIKLETESGRHFASDYSQWDEMFEYATKPSPKWAKVNIDDALADQIETRQRAQLMFFASEGISHVLRHAHATVIGVIFQAEGMGARLEIADDGAGFGPANVPEGRQGQRNLAARARELGAKLTIHSSPGKGTTTILLLPPETFVQATVL